MNQQQQIQTYINELYSLEAMGEQMRKRSYGLRIKLEKFSSPAPSGVKAKKLTELQEIKLVDNLRKSVIKKTAKR